VELLSVNKRSSSAEFWVQLTSYTYGNLKSKTTTIHKLTMHENRHTD